MGRSRGEVASRSIWFVARTLLIIALIAGLGWYAFKVAFNAGNMYILATEGMQLRAECVMQDGPKLELTEYFTAEFIENDELLSSGKYDDYTVSDYNYKLSLEGFSLNPWADRVTVQIVERVEQMQGAVNADRIPEDAPEDAEYPLPEWEAGRYKVTFVKEDGRWYIDELTLLEANPSMEPKRTPLLTPNPAEGGTE